MAQISEITIEELGLDSRLDAEYYQPFYLHSISAIQSTKGSTLSSFGKFIIGPFGSTVKIEDYVEHSNSRYIRGKDVKNFFVNDSDNAYIPDEKFNRLKQFHVKENDLLITVVGTLGNVSVVTPDVGNAIFSCKSTIFRPNEILPGYLCVYLNTKYGQGLLIRNERGAVQTGFNLKDLENILVPDFGDDFENKVNDTYFKAHELRQKSKFLYAQAEQVLLQELGLEDFTPEWMAGYETDFDNILEVARMDAEYFQPRYRIIEDKVKEYKNGWDYLPKLIEVSKEKIQIEPEKEYQYVELADINASIGIVDSTSKIFGADLPSRAKMKLQKDDVVVSSVEGSIDKVGLILSEDKNLVGSTGFHIFRSKAFTPEVNLILCKSPVLQYLFIREASGTILTAISSNSLKNIIVPKLDKEVQEKITKLVQESHKCVLESRQLLEQAKKEVEEMIESKAN